MSDSTQEEIHTGSIKTPKRLLLAEGVPGPRDFHAPALTGLPADTARAIMYDNGHRFMPGKP